MPVYWVEFEAPVASREGIGMIAIRSREVEAKDEADLQSIMKKLVIRRAILIRSSGTARR